MKAEDKVRLELPGREVIGKVIEVTELTKGYQRVKIAYPSYCVMEARCWGDEVVVQYFDNDISHLEIVLAPKKE